MMLRFLTIQQVLKQPPASLEACADPVMVAGLHLGLSCKKQPVALATANSSVSYRIP